MQQTEGEGNVSILTCTTVTCRFHLKMKVFEIKEQVRKEHFCTQRCDGVSVSLILGAQAGQTGTKTQIGDLLTPKLPFTTG